MADTEIETILRDLLARPELSAETRDELRDFEAQARAGRLDPADRDYVVALAGRLTGQPVAASSAAAPGDYDHDFEEEHSWRDRAHEAEQRAAAAEAALATVREALERFAGPAALTGADPETRRAIYESLSRELDRIERGET